MSTATDTEGLPSEELGPEVTSADAPAPENLVTAQVQDLIVGRVLRFPIYDSGGVLLLAEGMTLTEKFKRMLDARNMESVQVHAEDFSRLTFRGSQTEQGQSAKLDEELVKSLDKIVDSGLLFVANSEAALLDQITHHGCARYHRAKYLERIDRNKETSIFVDNLMRNALRGKKINCGEVTRLTASYLDDITTDIDSTLASKLDVLRQSPISDHCVGMAILAMAVGVEMGMDARNVRTIALAGLLHDWGMVLVPQEIREAPRRLTEDEYFEIAKHPMHTLKLLDAMCGVPTPVPLICYQVHERPNGGGYPQGRNGDRIHPMAKILAVADAYNALISPRPFRPPLTPYAAMECILRQAAAGDFDPQVARALLMVQSLFPIGSYVALGDGSVARVLRRNGPKFAQPIVRIVQDHEGKDVPEDSDASVIDLSAAGLEVVKALPTPGTNAVGLSPEILCGGWRSANAVSPLSAGEDPCDISSVIDGMQPPSAGGRSRGYSVDWISLEEYSEKQKRQASAALEILDGSRKMADHQYSDQRNHARRAIRSVVAIHLRNPEAPAWSLRPDDTFRAMTHDVSQGGMSFIYPDWLPTKDVLVGLSLSGDEITWFLGKIVRCREIGDTTFWLHSVAFQQRIQI